MSFYRFVPVEQKKAEGATRENEVLLQRRKGPGGEHVPNTQASITVSINFKLKFTCILLRLSSIREAGRPPVATFQRALLLFPLESVLVTLM